MPMGLGAHLGPSYVPGPSYASCIALYHNLMRQAEQAFFLTPILRMRKQAQITSVTFPSHTCDKELSWASGTSLL